MAILLIWNVVGDVELGIIQNVYGELKTKRIKSLQYYQNLETKDKWFCNIIGKCKYKRGNFLKSYELHLKDLGPED